MALLIPDFLTRACDGSPDATARLRRLPDAIRELAQRSALAQRVWTRLYACCETLAAGGEEAEREAFRRRSAEVLDRIGRQDPACAVAPLEASGEAG